MTVPTEPSMDEAAVTTQDRRSLGGRRLVAATVGVLLASAVLFVVIRDDGTGLRVVESGFSEVVQAQLAGTGEREHYVSWVVVVDNTRDRVAVDPWVEVRLVDEDGEVIEESSERLGLVLPDRQAATAGRSYDVAADRVADIEVELHEPDRWEDVTATTDPGLTADDLTVGYGVENQPIVAFTVTADQTAGDYHGVVVCRDPDGRPVAGWWWGNLDPVRIAAGESVDHTDASNFAVPEELGTVEVYVTHPNPWAE